MRIIFLKLNSTNTYFYLNKTDASLTADAKAAIIGKIMLP